METAKELIKQLNSIDECPGIEAKRAAEIGQSVLETNLAETKGSGIRTMRVLMKRAKMAPPTFESQRENNSFTARLLLHHLLTEKDLQWLDLFHAFELDDDQKTGLIFIREVGAIDNPTYRQLNDVDILKSSIQLRKLRDAEIITQKGKGRATYYVAGTVFQQVNTLFAAMNINDPEIIKKYIERSDNVKAPPEDVKAPPDEMTIEELKKKLAIPRVKYGDLPDGLPPDLLDELTGLGSRTADKNKIKNIIVKMCEGRELSSQMIAGYLNRTKKYVERTYIKQLMTEGRLKYTIPNMPHHPEQKYTAANPEK